MTAEDRAASAAPAFADPRRGVAVVVRIFGWSTLTILVAFLANDFLVLWLGWPGIAGVDGGPSPALAWLQVAFYAAALLLAVLHVLRDRERPLRADGWRVSDLNAYLIRTAFWAVLLIGVVDAGLALLQGEGLLDGLVGKTLADDLFRTGFRSTWVHLGLAVAAFPVAAVMRRLSVAWLSLLIVAAELALVLFRYVFSFEQVFMGDLVRFWYAALFLFGCAYTLRAEGHVRIDILYADFAPRTRGLVNAIGTLILGMPFCWAILGVGLAGRTGIINSALRTAEIEGLGDGMFMLYLMTVFMGVFAILMLVEFVGFLFRAVADILGEPDPA